MQRIGFVAACVLLGWVGSIPVRYLMFDRTSLYYYLFGYFIFLPILEILERYFGLSVCSSFVKILFFLLSFVP